MVRRARSSDVWKFFKCPASGEPPPGRGLPVTLASRLRAAAGVLGPAAFTVSWAVLGPQIEGYSAVDDQISRLAALGAPTRAVMTGGMVAYGVGAVLFADELRRRRAGPAWISLAASGAATLAVAAIPLGSPAAEPGHDLMAAAAYVSLAGTPLLAAAVGRSRGWWRAASWAAGSVSAAALAGALATDSGGLFQRLGLTVGDAWVAAAAIRVLRTRTPPNPPRVGVR